MSEYHSLVENWRTIDSQILDLLCAKQTVKEKICNLERLSGMDSARNARVRYLRRNITRKGSFYGLTDSTLEESLLDSIECHDN